MAEDDYTEVLEGTVDEVKDAIRDLEDPDLEALLDAEKEGKDRKTVKEFIESRMPEEEEEASEDGSEDLDEEEEEEIVEGIEEETAGGILGSYSGTSLLAGGVILGLVIGFVAAGFTGASTTPGDTSSSTVAPDLVRDSVETIAGVGLNTTPEVTEPEVRHSMYNMNVSTSIETENGTQSTSQEVYVTLDGEKLFIVQKQLGQTLMPIDVQNAVQQAQAAEQRATAQQQSPQQDPEANMTVQ